jgi:hypothetical protein
VKAQNFWGEIASVDAGFGVLQRVGGLDRILGWEILRHSANASFGSEMRVMQLGAGRRRHP